MVESVPKISKHCFSEVSSVRFERHPVIGSVNILYPTNITSFRLLFSILIKNLNQPKIISSPPKSKTRANLHQGLLKTKLRNTLATSAFPFPPRVMLRSTITSSRLLSKACSTSLIDPLQCYSRFLSSSSSSQYNHRPRSSSSTQCNNNNRPRSSGYSKGKSFNRPVTYSLKNKFIVGETAEHLASLVRDEKVVEIIRFVSIGL